MLKLGRPHFEGEHEADGLRFWDGEPTDPERVRLWTFARAAAEPRDEWKEDDLMALARALAP